MRMDSKVWNFHCSSATVPISFNWGLLLTFFPSLLSLQHPHSCTNPPVSNCSVLSACGAPGCEQTLTEEMFPCLQFHYASVFIQSQCIVYASCFHEQCKYPTTPYQISQNPRLEKQLSVITGTE